MIRNQAHLLDFAMLHTSGIYSMGSPLAEWGEGQTGPLDVRRDQVYDEPFPTFGKLQPADKLAFSTASLIFRKGGDIDGATTGISLGSTFGSLSTDLRFMESIDSGFPRPAYFSATLPSSPVAEIAIQYKLKGPNRVYAGGSCPGLTALDGALRMLATNKAQLVIVLYVNAVEMSDTQTAYCKDRPADQSCCALLLSNNPNKNSGPRVMLEGDFTTNLMDRTEKESYFHDAVKAMSEKRDIEIDLPNTVFTGKLTFKL